LTICADDVEMYIVPVIMNLAEPDSMDDFRTDAVLASCSLSLWRFNTTI